ncbi:hypothetical protein PIIN_01933 [Serendipita indica DSM 11827]|uniref:F-box domain-containing protein n=1 Tax=Serendipita indica (strain DSM 11827) TaxID=1109443 RepID=G4T9S3_SERID|nr:hypothetical protein PIIN_01933 [Serendipita indica DSM 11827]
MSQEDSRESKFQMERIPSEVLEDIFHLTSPNGSIQDSLPLSHVCRTWRLVSLSQRVLWLTVRVKLGVDLAMVRRYWSAMKNRTRGAGVTIDILDSISDTRLIDWWRQAYPILFRLFKNIDAVSITLLPIKKPIYILETLRHIPLPYHTLIIHGPSTKPPEGTTMEVCVADICAMSPEIKRVELYNMCFYLSPRLDRLLIEELVIQVPAFETKRSFIDAILIQCPLLRVLEVRDGDKPEDTYFGQPLGTPNPPENLESFVVDRAPHIIYSYGLNKPRVLPRLTKLLVHRPDRDRSRMIAFVRANPTIIECGFTFAWEVADYEHTVDWLTLKDLAGVAPQIKTLHIYAKYCGYDVVILLDDFNTQRTQNPLSFFPNLVTLRLDTVPFLSKVLFEDVVQACYPIALPGADVTSSRFSLKELAVTFKDNARENEKTEWLASSYLEKAEIYKLQAGSAWHVSW